MNNKTYRVRWGRGGFCDAAEFAVAADAFEFAVRMQREDGVYDVVLEMDATDRWQVGFGTHNRVVTVPSGTPLPTKTAMDALEKAFGIGAIELNKLEIDKSVNWFVRWSGGEIPFTLPPGQRPPDVMLLRTLFVTWTGRSPGSLNVTQG